jgi:hypothetical protein|tara:strand:- start:187 stop:537 length:351 start_codon:yes stop_codon:yes gene_type:complete
MLTLLVCCARWRVQATLAVIFAAIVLTAVAIDTPSEHAAASAAARRPRPRCDPSKGTPFSPMRPAAPLFLGATRFVGTVLRATFGRLRACTAAPLTATPGARARRYCEGCCAEQTP